MEIFSTYQSAQNQVLKADLPHNRPFPRHWCNKKRYLYFSQKSDSNQNLDFNPVPPQMFQRRTTDGQSCPSTTRAPQREWHFMHTNVHNSLMSMAIL